MIIIPQLARLGKAKLINLGLACLSRGEWQMVVAITRLIQQRGWSHV